MTPRHTHTLDFETSLERIINPWTEDDSIRQLDRRRSAQSEALRYAELNHYLPNHDPG
jgi:hypothetical protein